MQTVVMPKMGDTMEEGKILQWRKNEGDTVAKGDALAEIETEKVNIEAESFAEGVLRKILVQAGQSVPVGAPIALVGKPTEAIPPEFSDGPSAEKQSETPEKAPSPALTSAETPSSAPGRPTYGQGQAGAAPEETAPRVVDQPAARTAASGGSPSPQAPQYTPELAPIGANGYSSPGPNGVAARTVESTPAQASTAQHSGRVFISPIARRIAQEHNLDVRQIAGTGPGGRIIKEDVEAALSRPYQPQTQPTAQPTAQPAAQPVAQPAPAQPQPFPAAQPGEEYEAVPLSNMRRTIARRLQQSMQTTPHFYLTISVETMELAKLRAQVNSYTEQLAEPVKVSYNDLIVKAVASALRRFPQVNVSYAGDQLFFKKHINIGIAVALEQGLIVPVIRDADKRSVSEIAREAQRLAEAARSGKLKPEEFSGGTFSVSNLGMFGIEDFTAVINPPEAAILAVGAIMPSPVVVDGQLAIRDRMKLTLSIDHRALDGATGARFLQELKRLLEGPMGLIV
jgi:pyruvate dehydrogenase E2 component (dihydrolipoamide acetyltransferase)